MNATQVQDLTDKVAAITEAILGGVATARAGWSDVSLFGQLDAMGIPGLEVALGAACNRVDSSLYPEAYHTNTYAVSGGTSQEDKSPFADGVVSNAGLKAIYSAILNYVKTLDPVVNTSMAAYLANVAAQIHPVFAEIGYAASNTAFTNSSGLAPNVFGPAYGVIQPQAAYIGTAGSWADDTTDFADADAGDAPFFAADNDYLALGFDRKVTGLAFQLGTLGSVDAAAEFYYSAGGSTYRLMTATTHYVDNTAGFTKSDYIDLSVPADWIKSDMDHGGNYFAAGNKTPRYWILIKRTANTLVTPPVATQVNAVPAPVYSGTRLSGLVVQPALAIARVTATNTMSIVADSISPGGNYTQFQAPVALQLIPLCIQGTPAAITALTISYVDQGGANATKAQTINWTPALGTNEPSGASYLELDTLDTGIRSVRSTGWTIATTMTNCVFAVGQVLKRTVAL